MYRMYKEYLDVRIYRDQNDKNIPELDTCSRNFEFFRQDEILEFLRHNYIMIMS